MDLDSLKYSDLQRLAKDAGLKANIKADKLLKALKEHYKRQSPTENAEGELSEEKEDTNANQRLPNYDGTAFVTARRARGQKAKRKQIEDEESVAETNGSLPQSSAQTDEDSDKAAEEPGSPKRRKVSAEEDYGMALMEGNPEETKMEATATDGAAARPVGGEDQGSARPLGKIPRHEGLLKKNRPVLKPTTPNFKKLHEAHFNKMESIDSYVQRKTKQMEVIRKSVKELKMLSEKANIIKQVDEKTVKKPKVSRASLFSPVTQERRSVSDKRRLAKLSTSKPTLKTSNSFNPAVLSTRKMNVSFSQTTRNNEHKRSLVKTPARRSPHVDLVSTPTELVKPEAKKPEISSTKTPGVTPFVFCGNTSISNTPGTNKKNAFDLKASLSRPLSYQPHKGKLKPFAVVQENAALNSTQSHQKNYKQHKVQTRVERRTRHTEDRKQKKEKVLGARRGLAMS